MEPARDLAPSGPEQLIAASPRAHQRAYCGRSPAGAFISGFLWAVAAGSQQLPEPASCVDVILDDEHVEAATTIAPPADPT
jgi:hypothetical protein